MTAAAIGLDQKDIHRDSRYSDYTTRTVLGSRRQIASGLTNRQTICDQGQISRADIARATKLTRATVSDVVTELMKKGLVEEIGFGPSAGGMPPFCRASWTILDT
jgi:hypothetical protein